MLSALILNERGYPAVQLAPQPVYQRFVRPGPLVLGSALLKLPAPTTDRDRTVSRRSEPSSRATLIGEQPNPWDLLQPQDVTSRHRGAKPLVDLSSWERSACYPRSTFYPMSDGAPMSVRRITLPYFRTWSTCWSHSQARLCQCTLGAIAIRAERTLGSLRYSLEATTPVKLPTKQCPSCEVSPRTCKGWYFNVPSKHTGVHSSKGPTYPTHHTSKNSAKL